MPPRPKMTESDSTNAPPARPKFGGAAIFELDPPAPLGVMVVVRPRPAAKTIGSEGLIIAAKRTQQADLSIRTVGEVIAVGHHAFQAPIGPCDPKQDPTAQRIKVGSWVEYRQHAGQKLRIKKGAAEDRDAVPEYLVTLTDGDILNLFRDEAHAARYFDWTE